MSEENNGETPEADSAEETSGTDDVVEAEADASTASDEAVRDARRAYRAACQQSRSDAWCECMTGGMAQALPPQDLAIATAAFTGAGIEASSEARARVASTRGDVEQSCQQYR